jgi:VWFA-related protein
MISSAIAITNPRLTGAHLMKQLLQCLNAVLLWAMFVLVFAQHAATDNASEKTPTVRSRVELVLVPVIVNDGKGHHISGLKKEDFRLDENDKLQALSFFEEIASGKADQELTRSTPIPGYSNYVSRDFQERTVTILVLDLLNAPYVYQAEARKNLVKYLSKSLHSDQSVTLLVIGARGLRQVHSFTTDAKVLIAALSKIRGRFSTTEMNDPAPGDSSSTTALLDPAISNTADRFEEGFSEATVDMAAMDQRDATRRTLASLNQIALAFAGLPGRKALIWATAGFPFMIDDPNSINYMGLDMVDSYKQTWRALMSANISVYPVDLQGVLPRYPNRSFASTNNRAADRSGPTSASDVNRRRLRPWTREMPYDRHLEQQDTMRAFAAATGGIACMNFNDLAKCFEQATSDSSAYYLLGYYLTPDDRKPGWRKLKVEVRGEGMHVRAREGFYFGEPPKEDEQIRRTAIAAALISPVEYTGVPMNVQWSERPATNQATNKNLISAEFSVTLPASLFAPESPGGGMVDLLFSAIAFNDEGKAVAEITRAMNGKLEPDTVARIRRDGFHFQGVIDYPAKTKEVRFAIRNNSSGDIGSIIAPAPAP